MEKSNVEWTPRLSVEITEEQHRKLQNLIDWGLKKHIFNCIIEDLIKMIEENGEVFLAAILSRRIGLRNFLNLESKRDELVEALSWLEHEQWVEWSKSIAKTEEISDARLGRWEKFWVDYDKLDERDKRLDREWALKVMTIIREVLRG